MTQTRKRVLIFIAACLVFTVIYVAHRANEGIRNSYAVWWAADMVIEHLTANDNQWPLSWEELDDDYQTCVSRSGQPWTFEEIRRRVTIDFSVDRESLVDSVSSTTEPQFRIIGCSDGSDSHWQSREPNKMIFDHFKKRPRQQPVVTGFGGQ